MKRLLTPLTEGKNPQLPLLKERARTAKKRGLAKDNLKVVVRDGQRYCAWCAVKKLHGNKNQKYCGQSCMISSDVFFWPQAMGLEYLIERQDAKCAHCAFDFSIYIEKDLRRLREDYQDESYQRLLERRLERPWAQQVIRAVERFYTERSLSMEVDHVMAVALGGEVLGLENLQMLCCSCHRQKTREDIRKISEFKKRIG